MKNLILSMLVAILGGSGVKAMAETPMFKKLNGQCISDDQSNNISAEIKKVMLEGYEMIGLERAKTLGQCTYHFQKSSADINFLRTKLGLYEKNYEAKLKAQPSLHQGELGTTTAMYLYTYKNHYSKDLYLHAFTASCNYKSHAKWDAHQRELALGLKLLTRLETHDSWPNECLYFYVPDLNKVNLVDVGLDYK